MASRVIRKVRDMLDVDDAAIANGKTLVYRTASGKHEYEAAGGGGGPPSGAAGGVLSGTYPNPGFAADMATQAELDAMLAQAVILAPATPTRNRIIIADPAATGLIIQAHAAQTADLQRWVTSADAVLASISLGAAYSGVLSFQSRMNAYAPFGADYRSYVPASSFSTDNVVTPGLADNWGDFGLLDWMVSTSFDVSAGATKETWQTLIQRRADGMVTGFMETTTAGLIASRYNPDTEERRDHASLSVPHGFLLYNQDEAFQVWDDEAGTTRVFAFLRTAASWKWGVFGAASAPVVQQAASDVGALWTALKAYGWLDSGSAAPDLATQTELDAHVNDATAAHAATAVGFTPSGTIAATTVQAAIEEVASEAGGAPDAEDVAFTPTGTIAATDVQAAIAEVASEAAGGSGFPTADLRTATASKQLPLDVFGGGFVAAGSNFNTGANTADCMLIVINKTITINRILWKPVTASGNVDVGIYDDDGSSGSPGTRLVSTGSFACPAAGNVATTVASTTLTPGVYWMALAADNGTFATVSIVRNLLAALTTIRYTKGTSFPLPASLAGSSSSGSVDGALMTPAVA